MNRLLVTGIVIGSLFACTTGYSEEAKGQATPAAKPALKAPPVMEQMTLTGKITKEELTRKNKEGKEVTVTKYMLTDAQGVKTMLPNVKKTKEGTLDLNAFVGQQVKVTGMGHKGKLAKITDVEKVGEAPAAAPAETK